MSISSGSEYRRTDELKARGRRIWRAALLASLCVHILLWLIFRGDIAPRSPFAAAGPRAADDQAAAAGGGMQAVNLSVVVPVPVPQVPDPVPTPDAVVEPEPIPEPEVPRIEAATLPGTGGVVLGIGVETGIEGATGRGDGGTEDEGRFRVVPPTPRGLILPPGDRPGKVRGKEVAVWVFVTEAGAVVPDSTRLLPTTGDSKFDERLRKQAAQWVFQPARRDGTAVAEWFRYIISL